MDEIKEEIAVLLKNVNSLETKVNEIDVVENDGKKIPKEVLKDMLMKENRLRLSPEVQEIYADRHRNPFKGDWIAYTYKLQENLVKEFGYGESQEMIEWALVQLRTACVVYPDLAHIPLYVKYNRARRGELLVGDLAPNIVLKTPYPYPDDINDDVNLLGVAGMAAVNNKPLLICATSWS